MFKVIVIGSPGAGKSTFARKLRDLTGLPLYYLDMLWHRPDQTNISREAFDERLGEMLKTDKWIIDFPKNQLPRIYELLSQYRESSNIIIFRSRKEAEEYLEGMAGNKTDKRSQRMCLGCR